MADAKKSDLVTIIIPVYNVYDYLERCVSSVLGQTHRHLQIILINDGSTDDSGKLCDELASEHTQIETIHRKNGGSSAARNTGLDRVRGQWITFIDSDDYVSSRFIEESLDACLQHGADIAVSRFLLDFSGMLSDGDFRMASHHECITGREAVIRHFGKDAQILNPAGGKLCRASLWTTLRFPQGKVVEDVFISHELFHSACRVVILDSALYAYFQSSDSIMRKPFSLERLDALDAWMEGIRFLKRAGDRELLDIAHRVYCNRLIDAYGLCKKHLPKEHTIHIKLHSQIIEEYRVVKHVRAYIDMPKSKLILYRCKQRVGRYFPLLYSAIFLQKRTYI